MLRIKNIKISILKDNKESITKKINKLLNTNVEIINIVKKSIDARDKNNILYVYELDIKVANEEKYLSNDITITPKEEYILPETNLDKNIRPIIIGSGPSGLFSAYLLAELGYKPIIYEQGEDIDNRVKSIEEFWNNNKLNIKSNIQFGEGGAGTFSDGKLNTLVKDKNYRAKKVFEIFIENGAPEEIMYINKPHIGTDLLRNIIKNMRNKIISLGGEFYFNSKLTDIIIEDNKVKQIEINNKELIDCNILLLAIGHSARDTFYLLKDKNINMQNKPFAVGLRVMHDKEFIDNSQYGPMKKYLSAADYKLTYNTKEGRGVYSFCMCPGGYVINSSSEEKHLVINGMSNHNRDSKASNSAIVVTVNEKDYGTKLFDGLIYQRKLESIAYDILSGKIPTQSYKDFVDNKINNTPSTVSKEIKGAFGEANLNDIIPNYISNSIKEAMLSFDNKIKGFASTNPLLIGVETRTSSPVRIIRDDNGMSNIKGIYPCGEGAGYAGGITSAAIDGLKQTENIVKSTY